MLISFSNGEPLEIYKQGNDIVQSLVIKDLSGGLEVYLHGRVLAWHFQGSVFYPQHNKEDGEVVLAAVGHEVREGRSTNPEQSECWP